MITLCCTGPMFTFHDEVRCRTGFLCSCGMDITLTDERLAHIAERLEANGVTQITAGWLQRAIQTNYTIVTKETSP